MKYLAPIIALPIMAALASFEAGAQSIESPRSVESAPSSVPGPERDVLLADARPVPQAGRARLGAPSFARGVGPAEGPMGLSGGRGAPATPADELRGAGDPEAPPVLRSIVEDAEQIAGRRQACMEDAPQIILASLDNFRSDPRQWVESRAETPRQLLRDMRSITLSDPEVVNMIDANLLGGMRPTVKNALGIGVGRAARNCVQTDPGIQKFVEAAVFETNDNSYVEGYLLEVSRSPEPVRGLEVSTPRRITPQALEIARIEPTERAAPPVARLGNSFDSRLERLGRLRLATADDAGTGLGIPQLGGSPTLTAPSLMPRIAVQSPFQAARNGGGANGPVSLNIPFAGETGDRTIRVRGIASVSPTLP